LGYTVDANGKYIHTKKENSDPIEMIMFVCYGDREEEEEEEVEEEVEVEEVKPSSTQKLKNEYDTNEQDPATIKPAWDWFEDDNYNEHENEHENENEKEQLLTEPNKSVFDFMNNMNVTKAETQTQDTQKSITKKHNSSSYESVNDHESDHGNNEQEAEISSAEDEAKELLTEKQPISVMAAKTNQNNNTTTSQNSRQTIEKQQKSIAENENDDATNDHADAHPAEERNEMEKYKGKEKTKKRRYRCAG